MHNPSSAVPSRQRQEVPGPLGRWVARLLLFGPVAILYLSQLVGPDWRAVPLKAWQEPTLLLDWSGEVLLAVFIEGLAFLLLGLLVPLAIGRAATWRAWLMNLLLAAGLVWLIRAGASARLPTAADVAISAAPALFGTWIGMKLLRGPGAWRSLLAQVGFLLGALLAMVVVGTAFIVQDEPLEMESPEVTPAEKRRLARLFRNSPIRRRNGSPLREVTLNQRDVNVLLARGLSLDQQGRTARIRFDDGKATLRGSLRVPITGEQHVYLNLHLDGSLAVEEGKPSLRIDRLQLGRLRIPETVCDYLAAGAVSLLQSDPDIQHLLASLQRARIEEDRLHIVARDKEFTEEVVPALMDRLGPPGDVRSATEVQLRHLVQSAENQPPKGFTGFLTAAFRLAQKRSRQHDPRLENRAAILALAILFGPAHIEHLLQPAQSSEAESSQPWRRRLKPIALRGRFDLTKHFYGSAALTLLSNGSTSDAIGLLKEQVDTVRGGSGFSFTDLLADRAGTLFAVSATRDERSARRLQDRLAGDFALEDIFPKVEGLPEGISAEDFRARYGGIGGDGYQSVKREIERRLSDCRALQ